MGKKSKRSRETGLSREEEERIRKEYEQIDEMEEEDEDAEEDEEEEHDIEAESSRASEELSSDDDDDDDSDDDDEEDDEDEDDEDEDDEDEDEKRDVARGDAVNEEEEEEVPYNKDDVTTVETVVEFSEMGLDPRVLKAIAKQQFSKPTLVQSASIPLALGGRDILARARTGSGKTAAFVIPIVHLLLSSAVGREHAAESSEHALGVRAVVLVPTAELCAQTHKVFVDFTAYCEKEVTCAYITRMMSDAVQLKRLAELPDVLISTPSLLLRHLQQESVVVRDTLQIVAIDEADLLLSFGYEEDLRKMSNEYFPSRALQTFLMSATLSKQVDELKKMILTRPAILRLQDAEPSAEQNLVQYTIRCPAKDKNLLIFALVKLNLIKGKALFFVNGVQRCYRLKLFFERCGIQAAVLNSELPQNSRAHVLEEFNRDKFRYLIASDESLGQLDQQAKKAKKSKSKAARVDLEYGVSRGVDFKGVNFVINFDFPKTVKNYVHRIGRTARAGAKGKAISIVTSSDDKVATRAAKHVADNGCEVKQFGFNLDLLEGFRYRVDDMQKSITTQSIRKARLAEIEREIRNSKRLETHFDDNPTDRVLFKHTSKLQPTKAQAHWSTIPSYLVPRGMEQPKTEAFTRAAQPKKRKRRGDPLRSFKAGSKRPGDDLSRDHGAKRHKKH